MPKEFERRRVGQTAMTVPTFGYGAAHLGELYSLVTEADASATIDAAWDAGVRLFDTAPWYGLGLSEHRLGYGLRHRPRNEYQLITKVGRILERPFDPATFKSEMWLGGLPFQHRYDYSYDGIMRSYEQSMMRLGLNTIDALVIHDLDAAYQGPDFGYRKKDLVYSGIKALEELKRRGEIKAIGMGINTAEALETVAPLVDLDFVLVAMPYTLIDQGCLHTGMAECVKRKVSVIIGSPFASGILVTGSGGSANYNYSKAPEAVQAKVRGIEAVCKAHGVALPAAALQFVLAHPAVVSEIPGAVKPSEVTENVASHHAPIPAGFWSDLKAEGLIDKDAPTP
ncbi:aldo/keto reductase [Labrys sp. LIt4]|uniref:aldo/keto reductase n=1 Tax=Labrys sp. LIt4 TaxID=2821355 RepID=UPI001ADF986E|nr:aldo/keto reductase [Labrys sp. LIt4]MBP0579882.1 aldo/keto reductase [Labrys sp. LIt4]